MAKTTKSKIVDVQACVGYRCSNGGVVYAHCTVQYSSNTIETLASVITKKFMLAPGFIQSTLWRGLANVSIVLVQYGTVQVMAFPLHAVFRFKKRAPKGASHNKNAA